MAALRDRIGADEEFLQELIGVFVTTMEERVVALVAAVNRDEAEVIATEAHAIKGAAANVDAHSLAAAAAALESSARKGLIVAHEVETLRSAWYATQRHPALHVGGAASAGTVKDSSMGDGSNGAPALAIA